jgi:OTU domain-containing protein 6
MEQEMEQRHQMEILNFNTMVLSLQNTNQDNTSANDSATAESHPDESLPPDEHSAQSKQNRQKRRKEKKQAQMQEMMLQAKLEASQSVDMKQMENTAISKIISDLGLQIKEIVADGHCLYNAIADQLGNSMGYKEIRKIAANYLAAHPDDFLPFMTNDSGDLMSPSDYKIYCDKVENSATWGGEIELRAISESLSRQIHIIQMGSEILKIGENFPDSSPIMLSYHRHAYGLGEHYNSLIK